MDKLLERCAKHRQATRGRKSKRTRSPRRNTSEIKHHATATTSAPEPIHQTTNQAKKVSQDASSGHASTTKYPEPKSQARIELTHSPRDENISWFQKEGSDQTDNPVMKRSTVKPDGLKIKLTEQNKHGNSAISTAQPASHAPDTDKTDSKARERENGLTPAGALTPARENASSANKLSQTQRSHVYQLLAAGYRNSTILAHIRHNLGIKVSRQSINAMRHRQPERVEEGRRDIQKEIGLAAPIANKIHRIAKRQELINSLERKLWRTTSVTKGGTRLLTGTHETINRILDSVKAELEPYEVNVSVDLRGKTAQQYKDVTDSGVISEAMDKLKAAGMEIAHVVAPDK